MFSTKGLVTDDYKEILKNLDQKAVWGYLLGTEIVPGKKILSPLRKESDPSAVFFWSKEQNLLIHDFSMGTYNLWDFLRKVRKMTSLEAIKLLKSLQEVSKYQRDEKVSVIQPNEARKVFVKQVNWQEHELAYFKEFHISRETLLELNVFPIDRYWISKNQELHLFKRKKNELLFAFNPREGKYKIYRPESKGEDKWFGNMNKNTLFGWESLPFNGDLLIITKGIKELGVLRELKYDSVAIQAEKSYPKDEIIKMLIQRFKKIYVLMDNDKTGLEANQYFKDKYGFKVISLPEFDGKDLADLSKLTGLENCKQLIEMQL